MDELIVIRPEHPFSNRELLFLALCPGAPAWLAPFLVTLSLAYVPVLHDGGSLLRILALTLLPAAATGALTYLVKDRRDTSWPS